jgi:hypothetical protein
MYFASRNESRPSSPTFLSVSLKSFVANRRGYWKALSEMFQAQNLLCNLLNLASNHTLDISWKSPRSALRFCIFTQMFRPEIRRLDEFFPPIVFLGRSVTLW